jgi:cyanophycinase
MRGPIALVGAGEFLDTMAEFDRDLLAATGRRRPRVVILPTASANDGEAVFLSWAERGVAHFASLGAEVEPVLVRNAAEGSDAAVLQAVGEADLVYLSGGDPRHLLRVFRDSALGAALVAANARGTVMAGCSAGAMALVWRSMNFWSLPRAPFPMPFPMRWQPALGMVDRVVVLPHYDAVPEAFSACIALQAPRGSVPFGIDEHTAVVGRDGAWQVYGAGRVTVWRGRRRERFRRGEAFRA